METWLPIPGYEGKYEVSDCGRVKRVGVDALGRKRYMNHFLSVHPSGHKRITSRIAQVGLSRDGKLKTYGVHQLVMLAFCGPRPEGQNVNHKDGNRFNNRRDNLEYTTYSQNYRHALDVLGFQPPRGSSHWSTKLTEADIIAIRARCSAGEMQKTVAASYGLYSGHVSLIVNRKTWKHVP